MGGGIHGAQSEPQERQHSPRGATGLPRCEQSYGQLVQVPTRLPPLPSLCSSDPEPNHLPALTRLLPKYSVTEIRKVTDRACLSECERFSIALLALTV